MRASAWFNGLEVLIYSLEEHPNRGAITPESKKLRHLLCGNKPHIYRVIYAVDGRAKKVRVVHIRHGAKDAFMPEQAR
jgi:plasmid stabilization system protein ParE